MTGFTISDIYRQHTTRADISKRQAELDAYLESLSFRDRIDAILCGSDTNVFRLGWTHLHGVNQQPLTDAQRAIVEKAAEYFATYPDVDPLP